MSRGQLILVLALAGGGLVLFPPLLSSWSRWRRVEPDVAAEAKEYLRVRNVRPLDVPLDRLLAENGDSAAPSLAHPLLGQRAPDFELRDHAGKLHHLSDHLARGPVVVVFYYGYYCNHCVSQLFALDDDIARFHELGAEVMAISADSSQDTAEKFGRYGMFGFPVLSDPDNRVAAAYSVFAPATPTTQEVLLHGTFVIDGDGLVRWCHYAHEPFTDNRTLLVELARSQGRTLPAPPSPAAPFRAQ